jgi:hypothetical protein
VKYAGLQRPCSFRLPKQLIKYHPNSLINMITNVQPVKKTYTSPQVDVWAMEEQAIMQNSAYEKGAVHSTSQTEENTRMKVDSSFDW